MPSFPWKAICGAAADSIPFIAFKSRGRIQKKSLFQATGSLVQLWLFHCESFRSFIYGFRVSLLYYSVIVLSSEKYILNIIAIYIILCKIIF